MLQHRAPRRAAGRRAGRGARAGYAPPVTDASGGLPGLHLGATPWREDAAGPRALAEQAERAEALGFASFWLPEHHFSGASAIPSPLLSLAAVAARTRRLRLGTTSYLLPVRHPVHVAEEVAVLDRLSGGRVILGVGRGFRSAVFAAFGVPAAEKRDRFEAALAVCRDAWAGKPVAWDADASGARTPVVVSPRPVQEPHPPVWVAAFGPKGVAQAGRLGLPYLASPIEPEDTLAANLARHAEALPEALRGVPRPVPVMRTVFASRSGTTLRAVREGLARQAAVLARAPLSHLRRAAAADVDTIAILGAPDAVAERVARLRERLGVTHLVVRPAVPGVETGAVEESLALLAETLGARP